MADPDFDPLDPTQRYGNAPPGTLLPPMDPGETGPPSRTLSPTAAEGIHIPPTARSSADNAAIAGLMKPRPATTAEMKPHPSEGFDKAQDQRPAKSAPHQKAPTRNYSDLGRPPPDTVLPPHPWELPNVLHSIGGIFSEIGGRVTNNLGLASQKGTDAYWNQRDKSRRANDEHAAARARLEYENMVMSHQRLQEQVETELIDYRRAMYGDPRKSQQQLLDVAKKHLDPKLEFIVTHQGVQKGLEYLQQMDQAFQDLRMSNSQIQKIQQENSGGDAALFRPPDPERPIDAPSSDQPPSDQSSLGQPAAPVGGVPLVVAPPADQGAPSGQAPVPAPASPAETAPSAAPGGQAPYEIPGVPNTSTPQGSLAPSVAPPADIGAAQPDQGVLVAGGGIEDVPRNWYEKMPPVQGGTTPTGEPPYEWTEPPSQTMVDAKSALSGRPITNTTLVNDDARRAVQDPSYIDELKKQGNPERARMALTRATEILQNLNSIATDRHPPGPWMDKAIHSQVPGLENDIKQIAAGHQAPPTQRQQYGKDPYPRLVARLVAKVDPTMADPGIYQMRNRARIYWAVGPGGQLMRDQGAAYLHGQDLLSALDNVKDMNIWTKLTARYASPDILKGTLTATDEESKLIYSVQRRAEVFFHEAEAILNKGRPTVAGQRQQQQEFNIDWGRPAGLRQSVEDMLGALQKKMGDNIMLFHAGTGQGAEELDRLFHAYAQQGASPAAQQSRQVQGAIHNMITGGSVAPRGQAPAASSDQVHDYTDYFR